MQEVQLYIGGQKVELFKDETISLTQTIQNVRDISKVFTDFTKQFNVPASKDNNKIFKHYYNYDIVNGFDARIRVDALIKLNGVDFRKGKIKLNNVSLDDNVANSYKVVFYGEIVSLKDLFNDDELSDLTSLNSFDTLYNTSIVPSFLQRDPNSNDLIAPLISVKDQFYYDSSAGANLTKNLYYNGINAQGVSFNDIKYALRIHNILSAIQNKYSITFSDDFFNTTNDVYYKLFIWLSRESGEIKESEQVTDIVTVVDGWTATSLDNIAYMYDESTLRVGSDWDLTERDLVFQTSIVNTTLYGITIYKDNEIFQTKRDLSGDASIRIKDVVAGDYTVEISTTASLQFNQIQWNITSIPVDDFSFLTGVFNSNSSPDFQIIKNIPKIKILDFLTGLFKMFNLTAYFENDILVVKTLDSFYSLGVDYDITKYIDIEKTDVNVALPFKKVDLKYKDTKTYLAAKHKSLFAEEWGGIEYDNGENLDGNTYTVEAPFSHMKYERLLDLSDNTRTTIQWGYSVNDSQSVYSGAPLLFYPILQTGTSVSYFDTNLNKQELTSYNVPSNSLSLDSSISTQNINFDLNINEYDGSTDFNRTLFNDYYKTYLLDVFNIKSRIIKKTANLPLSILLNYNLSDRFIINGKKFKINSSKVNLQTGKTDLELINDFSVKDITPPSVPTDITISEETQTTFKVNWTASTDNIQVKNYDVYIDSVYYDTTSLTMLEVTSLSSSTTYSVQVLARDISDNVSALSTSVNGTTTTPAVVPPSLPTNLTVIQASGTKPNLTINWDDSIAGDLAIDYYNVWRSVNSGSYVNIVQRTTSDYLDISTSFDNEYCYKIEAIDTGLNSSGLTAAVCETPTEIPPI